VNLDTTALAIGFAAGALTAALAMLYRLRHAEVTRLRAELRAETLESEREAQRELTDIEGLLRPLHATIELYQREARDLAAQRERESGRVSETLRRLAEETERLGQALRTPQARGRWGELTLRRTAELAGLSAHCDFTEQKTLETNEGRLRPDMLIHLPGNREIAVDAKVPLTAYLDAIETTDSGKHAEKLELHTRHLKRHVEALASKGYQTHLPSAAEFVVMFLPNDGFLSAATEKDPGIVEFALARNVVLATPATFFALLAVVAQGWKQEQISSNAALLCELGQEMHERLATFTEHLTRVGFALDKSVDHYNAAIGSFASRILPHARKFEELGAEGNKSLPSPEPIESRPRTESA